MSDIRVLCVDDDPSRLDLAGTFLDRESDRIAVRTAETADDALEVLHARPVDCIVCDYDLADATGLETLRTVRETHPDLPFVLFTAKGSESVAADAIAAGVTDYLQKGGPETYALLANRIENAVDGARAQARLDRTRKKTAQLHAHAADIAGARSRDAVYDAALSAAADILEFSVYGLYEARDGAFHPVGADSYDPGDRPTLDAGVLGQTYQRGESVVVDDATADDAAAPAEPSFQSALSVPVGDDLVFQAIAEEHAAFTTSDLELAELLATHVAQAIDRIDHERERRRTNDRLRAIVDNTTAIVYSKDCEGRYELVNERFQELVGLDESEMLGRTDWELQDEEYATEVRENDERAIEEAAPVEVEERCVFDGEERTYYSVKVPLFEDGEPTGVCGISADITELKRRERKLERQRNRLDEFASVVSHDLRGPLSVADGYRDLLAEDVDDPRLDEIADAHDRMEELIEDVLALAREGETVVDPEPVPVESVVESARSGATVDADVDVRVEYPGVVDADRTRLRRLLENCFRNAIEHGGDVSTIRVTGTENGFAIVDDGDGVPEAERDDIFDFGVSSGSGTGIGLAVVREIVDAHDWTVRCEESDAGGACFVVETTASARPPAVTR